MEITVVIFMKYLYVYQLRTKFYPPFFSQNYHYILLVFRIKNILDFDVTAQILFIYRTC